MPLTNATRLVVVLASILLITKVRCTAQQSARRNDYGTLKVLSVRKMSAAEHERVGADEIADYLVRFRFEAPEQHSVLVYLMDCGPPSGYALRRQGTKVRWLAADQGEGEDPSKSPGFQRFVTYFHSERNGCWLRMGSGSAYEWELAQASPKESGEEDAESIFVKPSKDAEPVELISQWYRVGQDDHGTSAEQ